MKGKRKNETSNSEQDQNDDLKRKRTSTNSKDLPNLEHPDVQNTPDADRFNNDCTVYIEGLPFVATEDDVQKFFLSVGNIVEVRLPKWHDSGRLRGYGHVLFSSADSATKALQLDGNPMKSRYIKIARPMTPRTFQAKPDNATIIRPPGCKTVFIKNLPYDCTEEEIHEVFHVFGKIHNIRLAIWGHTQQLKGFGYVDFKSEESAEIAVKKSSSIAVKGRKVICDFETGTPKGSFREVDGKLWKKKTIKK